LIFVGFQVRQNSAGLRHSAVQIQMSAFQDLTAVVVSSSDEAEVWGNGLNNPEKLEGFALMRYYIMANRMLHTYQGLHWQWQRGILDDGLFFSMTQLLRDLSGLPGWRKVWNNRRHQFSSGFQSYMDDMFAEGSSHTLFPDIVSADEG
jgi:hypothetical protein